MDYSKFPNHSIACIDMMSFYASCMASLHNLDVQKVPIAVVGNFQQKGSVVLAASPPMKKRFQVKTGTRLYEIPKHPEIRLFEPKMQYFLEMSMAITRILHKYVPAEAIHVYSVDESFIDLQGTEKLWGDPEQTVKTIQREIYGSLDLPSTAGMGPNRLLAKLALDLEAKKTGFAHWTYEDVQTKLWPVSPLSKMWGIGSRTEKTLHDMGIYTVGDIVNAGLSRLENTFGLLGNQLYYHAWGIDLSKMGASYLEEQVSYGKGQTLMRDYVTRESVLVVILEMCEDVCSRTRNAGKQARTIHLSVVYSKHVLRGGFSRSLTIEEASNDTMKIYETCVTLFDKYHDGRPVRKVTVSLTNLENETSMQLSLFEEDNWRKRQLSRTMDDIRNKYGSTAILRAVSLTDAGTAIKRSSLVGGHK